MVLRLHEGEMIAVDPFLFYVHVLSFALSKLGFKFCSFVWCRKSLQWLKKPELISMFGDKMQNSVLEEPCVW